MLFLLAHQAARLSCARTGKAGRKSRQLRQREFDFRTNCVSLTQKIRTTIVRARLQRPIPTNNSREAATMLETIRTKHCASILPALAAGLAAALAPLPALAQQDVNYGVQPDTDPSFIAKALGYFEPIEKKHN